MFDRGRGSRAAALALTALGASCATNPVTGERDFALMSEAQEIELGRQSDAQITAEIGVYDDSALQQYASRTRLQLANLTERPNLPWQFTVVSRRPQRRCHQAGDAGGDERLDIGAAATARVTNQGRGGELK